MAWTMRMSICVSQYDPFKSAAIKKIASERWPWHWYSDDPESNYLPGDDLYGDDVYSSDNDLPDVDDIDTYVEKLSLDVWLTNGDYCSVMVATHYVGCDDDGCIRCGGCIDEEGEGYELTESDYFRLLREIG